MSDRHGSDDALRHLEPINRDELLASWSSSEAKQALLEEITSVPVEAPTPTRTAVSPRRLVPILAVVVMMLGAVGAYAASEYFGEDIPNSPWITTEQAAERVPDLADGIPVPDGRDLSSRAQLYREMRPGRVQVAGIQERLADDAVCMWLDEWRTAYRAGDDQRAAAALDVIEDAPSWSYWTINNAKTIPAHVRQLADAAQRGDTEAVSTELGLNCPTYTTSVAPVVPTG